MDYSRYLYQMNKLHEARSIKEHHCQRSEVSTLRTGDYEFKRIIVRFLKQGDKVKAAVFFRGREIVHQSIGRALLARLVEELAEVGAVEARPKMEGPNLIAIFAPKAGTGGSPKAPKQNAETKNP
jgi:translation initiation factor IF-3